MWSAEDGSASGGVGAMERSEDSSGSLLGGEADSVDSSGWSDTVGVSDMDQISAELANRGPPKSDLKLRYRLTCCLFFVMLYSPTVYQLLFFGEFSNEKFCLQFCDCWLDDRKNIHLIKVPQSKRLAGKSGSKMASFLSNVFGLFCGHG